MDGSLVRRCVAVAAHGRRCQQTPYRGGPYCWHHTQSRKVWAPSRPLEAGARTAGAPAVQPPGPSAAERLPGLLAGLDDADLVRFLDEVDSGVLCIEKRDGALVAVRLEATTVSA
jgi:hypothetical protein